MMVMQELNEKENKTIVFVTHEPDIAAFSNRTILLRDGKLVKDMVNENKRSARDAWEALPKAEEV
jgi:putative ABC transport system ATP-binding protein